MIYRTVGIGGNHVDYEDMYSFLCGLGAWGDDYDFDLISDVTLDNWPDISLAANRVNQNGHSIKLHCSFNAARPTKPDLWKKITLTGADGEMRYTHEIGADLTNDICNVENLFFDHISDHGSILLSIRCWLSSDGSTWSVKKCYFKGYGTLDECAIRAINVNDYYNIEDIVTYGCHRGLFLYPSVIGTTDNPNRKNIKDCTILVPTSYRGIDIVDVLGNNIIFKNVAVFKTGGGVCWAKSAGAGDPDRFQLYNCSDSDNSIVTNLISNTVISNCKPNISANDNLQSADSADLGNGFLDLIKGTQTIEPDGSETFTGGAPDLGKTGIDSGLLDDIYNRDKPGDDSEFSIGAFEMQYLVTDLSLSNNLEGLGLTNQILLREPNWIQLPKGNFDLSREINQYVGTTLNIYNLTNRVISDFIYLYSNLNKESEYYFTNFFCSRRGKHKRFWLPYWKNPFILQNDISSGDTILTIRDCNYSLIDQGYERIFFKLKDGSIITREVTAVVKNGTNEDIFLTTAINRDISRSQIKFFSRLLLVRFNQDEMEVKFHSDNKSDIQFSFRELPFEHEERES